MANVAKFLFEDVICRHGDSGRIIIDGGPENKAETEELIALHGVRRIPISAYHPQSNGRVERGHGPIVNSIAKYYQRCSEQGPHYLPLMLWANRIIVKRTTGYSAFRLMYGRDCLLLMETSITSWNVVDWRKVRTTEDLLLARMQQLDEQVLDVAHAAEALERARQGNKA